MGVDAETAERDLVPFDDAVIPLLPRLAPIDRLVDALLVLGPRPDDAGIVGVDGQGKDGDLVGGKPRPRGDADVPLNPSSAPIVALVDAAGVIGDKHHILVQWMDTNIIAQPAARAAGSGPEIPRRDRKERPDDADVVKPRLGCIQGFERKTAKHDRALVIGETGQQFVIHIDLDRWSLDTNPHRVPDPQRERNVPRQQVEELGANLLLDV